MRVAKDYEDKETEAMLYGTLFHEAAEDFVKNGVSIPEKFKYAEKALPNLRDRPGKKLCEYK